MIREDMAITKDIVESAYCFLHQKQRVYQYSTLDWQKDDIEYAIESYVDSMSPELYKRISHGRTDFLRNHTIFAEDILNALEGTLHHSNIPHSHKHPNFHCLRK